jgi:predicted DNA-binding transcriptional regulator AlpA
MSGMPIWEPACEDTKEALAAEARGRDALGMPIIRPSKWPSAAYKAGYEQGQRDALEDLIVSARTAAAILGVSRQRIYQMINEGKLPRRRPMVFTRAEIATAKGDSDE